MNEPREVMDIHTAAEYLGISDDTLYRYAIEARVPCFKLGNRWRFLRSRLDEWMQFLSNEQYLKTVPVRMDAAAICMQCVEVGPNRKCPVHRGVA